MSNDDWAILEEFDNEDADKIVEQELKVLNRKYKDNETAEKED